MEDIPIENIEKTIPGRISLIKKSGFMSKLLYNKTNAEIIMGEIIQIKKISIAYLSDFIIKLIIFSI